MQIAILGAGHIGGTLGEKWAQAGHRVHFGVRDPHKPEVQTLVQALGGNASAASVEDAISAGEVILFAIPGATTAQTAKTYARALDGKIIIDATNNIRAATVNSTAVFAEQTPHASVYRAFNSYGWENFKTPVFGDTHADLFYCGTAGAARQTVEQLITDVGMNPVYIGGIEQADLLDGVLKLWFALAQGQQMGRHLALKVLTD